MFDAVESRTTEIDAPIELVYSVITDFEKYPEWASALQKVVVHDGESSSTTRSGDFRRASTNENRPRVVEFFGRAIGFQARYSLAYKYEPPTKLEWSLVDGEIRGLFLKVSLSSLEGSYVFEPTPEGKTRAIYTLKVAFPKALGPLRRKAEEIVMETGLKDLQRRAELIARRDQGRQEASSSR